MTHPIGYPTLVNPTPTTYADAYAADASNPKKFKDPGVVPNNAAQGITRISGYVSCSSCHAVHFADSDSATLDGLGNVAGLNPGDGHLLKADGPTKANKSALCQTCHTYQRHGNPNFAQEDVGCLVCHSAHAYNGGTPNYFVLRNTLTTVTFGAKTNALYTPLTDAFLMNKRNGAGFCERCHGLSPAIPYHSLATGGTEDRYLQNCKDCHKHNEAGFDFSWKWSGNSNLCGDCHGFPPYLSVEGDFRDTGADVGTRGGYAVMDGGSDDSHTYFTSGYYKAEAGTPHKSHAGGGENLGASTEVTDYKFAEGQGACTATCHDLNSHKQIDNTASFRNMVWGPIAKGNIAPNTVNLNPVYTTTGNGSCGTVYCHSNGGARPAGVDRAKISTDFKFAPTNPAWATGDADIIGNATECATFCHGNSTTSMATGAPATNRNNSVSHIKHLAKGYACNVCHKLTAGVGSTTVVLNAARLAPTGTHVNGKSDVGFDTSNDFNPGATGTQLNIIKPASGDAGSGYTATTGVCNVYCHSDGKAVRTYANVDWDQASTGVCGTCHQYYSGGVPTGSGAALSATHSKHFAMTVTLTCDDCHGTNASAGTHTDHVNTLLTTVTGSCTTCHGIDGGEAVPQWNAPMSNDYCISCHTGGSFGNIKGVMNAPNKQHAATRGHNRTTNYPSGNLPGNKLCTSCHLTSITNHVNVTDGDATHLVAAATTCTITCHGPSGSAGKDGIITHVVTCTACHDPHGDTTQTNIYMIRSASTGNYNGTVVFTNRGNDVTPLTATNSFDEDDDASLATHIENNADDLCATCHTALGGSGHNNRDNTPTNARHHQGETCMTASCHKPHTNAAGAFKFGAGSGCNGCHGYPPSTGAHGDGTNKHTRVTLPDRAGEDLTDCAKCHTGAELYTYDLGLDFAAGGARANHGVGDVNQKNVLTASVGYHQTNFSCTTACHLSTAVDGAWTDVSGLNCTACHYYVVGATNSANNTAATPKDLKGSHNAHFAKQKQCLACHNVSSDTTHISIPTGTDLQKIQNRAVALQNEADVIGTLATQSDPGNETCSGAGVALGCHNTKATPAWTTTGITCTNCHTPGGAAAADPTSGLHIGPITVSGKVHNNTLGSGCAHCHSTLTAQTTHFNAAFEGGNTQKVQMGLLAAYTQTADNTGTCTGAGVAAGCHSDAGNWARKWTTTARNSDSTVCANCHGNYSAGWNSGVIHSQFATRGASHSNAGTLTYPCTDCHVIGASNSTYLFTLGSNDWQVVELGTTKHGDNKLQMNSNTTGFSDAGARVGCATATCHTTISDPYDFQKSVIFTTANTKLVQLAGDVPPVTCYNCHGGAIIGTNKNSYWPDKANSFEGGGILSEDNIGRHQIHMEKLALSIYNETIAQLLTNNGNGTADFKQKALCDYCHAGASNHGNKVNLPAQVTTMYNGWLPKTADDATWAAASNGNCTNLNCHNGKATVTTANFTWYGTGTQNCVVCHNDITDTTAGTTGASHAAHTASAATFGKTINCASCHGGSPSWSPYTVASATAGNKHIDGQFKVGTAANAPIAFAYGGTYASAATRTVGSCAVNLCHNNGKNAPAPLYTWQTAITGCAACHATSSALGGNSHTAHLVAGFATTFGKAANCQDCHDAVSAVSMAGKTMHMDGVVNLAAGLTYSGSPGTLDLNNATVGACTGSCHTNGKAAAPVTVATWNTIYTNCNICHLAPNTAGNDGARHVKHVGNTAKVPTSCGECHLTATTTTYNSTNHLNATINTGNKITAHTNGTATCTNSCHLVNVARGDWLDTAALACTDCHQIGSTYTGEAAKPLRATPNGLHKATVALAHDDSFGAGGTCTSCHTTMTVDLPASHVNGLTNDLNTAYGLFASYNTGTSSCSGSGVATACHTDGGDWNRRWVGVTDAKPLQTNNPGDAVCNNCHGDHVNGWRWTEANATTTDHTDPNANSTDNVTSSHQVCQTCHGWGSAGYNRIWLGSSNATYKGHGDGHITLNGPLATGSGYDNTTGGCALSCHGDNATHRLKFNSGWTENYGDYGSANTCEACHAAKVAEAKHARHNNVSPTIATDLTDCVKCHPNAGSYTPAGGHADHKNTFVTLGSGIAGGATGCTAACHASNGTDGFWTDADGLNCTACHFADATPTLLENTGHARPLSATHNKHFAKGKLCDACHSVAFSPTFLSVVGPLAHIDNTSGANQGAIFTGKAAAAQDEATITRASTTFDDDGVDNILGNADDNTCAGGIGLGCHASGTPDWDIPITACITCHTDETTSAVNPTSGLHNFATATRHDDTLASGVCINCHSSTSPSSLHQNGIKNSASTATFTWQANVTTYSAANGCTATCHTDGGDWRRKWSGALDARPLNTNNPGDAICDNCHGAPTAFDAAASWRWNEANGTTVDHTDPYTGNVGNRMDQHSVCQTCHGWGNANYNETWLGSSNIGYLGHGDRHITLNGPVGTSTGYNNVSGGCSSACHAETPFVLNSNSSWTANYGNFGGGGGTCNSCHGYPPLETLDAVNFPDGGLQKYAGSGKSHALNKHVPFGSLKATGWGNCNKCHTEADHNMSATTWATNRTSKTYPKVQLNPTLNQGGTATATYNMGNADTLDGMGQCATSTCHFTESPKWDCSP